MADPIPSADAALLAAQSKAGQAGVDAYQAAKQELMSQRQKAIEQAMQEAALRGSPGGAVGSIQSNITQPYDQGIAAMTAGSANYQANMASRDRQLSDYSALTQTARSLIPGQVEMQVAPIRAQNEYNLRSQQLAGDRSVSEIQANTELEKARMMAAIEAAKRKAAADAAKAAADAAKLNDSQLTGLLDPQVADLLSNESSTVQGMLAQNVQQRRADAARQSGLTPVEQQQAGAANASATNARLAAAYGGRGLAQAKANQFASAAGASVPQPLAPQQAPAPVRPTGPQTGFPSMTDITGGAAQLFGQTPEELGANRLPVTPSLARPPSPAEVAAGRVAALQSATTPSSAVADQQQQYQTMRDAVPGAVAPAAQFHLQQLLRPMQALNATANNYTVAGPSGNRIGITPDQLGALTPEQRVMLVGGSGAGPLVTPEDFQANLLGDPTARMNRGMPSPVPGSQSSDAVRAAYQIAAQRLASQGGYNITDAQLAAAMPAKVPSVYDFLAGRSDQPTSTDAYAANTAALTAQVAGQTADQKQADEVADNALMTDPRYGASVVGAKVGTPTSVLDFVTGSSDNSTKAQYEEAMAAINDLSTNWVQKNQDNLGEINGPKLRRALQSYTTPMGTKLSPRAISIALVMSGNA